MPSLSNTLGRLRASFTEEKVSIGDIMKALPRGSYEMMLLLFALFIALPIPYPPGFSTIVIAPVILAAVQQIWGHPQPWLPKKIREKKLSRTTLEKVIDKAMPWAKRLERLMRPRLQFMTHGMALRFTALAVLIMAACIAVPFPFTNKVPAICIIFTCTGIIMHDGLVVLLSIIAGLGWVLLLAFLGVEGVTLLIEFLKSWF